MPEHIHLHISEPEKRTPSPVKCKQQNQARLARAGAFVYGATGVPARPPKSRAGGVGEVPLDKAKVLLKTDLSS
jgi:hypothetical protein